MVEKKFRQEYSLMISISVSSPSANGFGAGFG